MDLQDKITAALIAFIIALTLLGCMPECDETVYGENEDGTTYEECVTYNN